MATAGAVGGGDVTQHLHASWSGRSRDAVTGPVGTRSSRRSAAGWVRPVSARPWRAAAYLLTRGALPAVSAAAIVTASAHGWDTALAVGMPLLAGYLVLAVLTATPLQRRPVVLLGQTSIAAPHQRDDTQHPLHALRRRVWGAPTGRELLHALLILALSPVDVLVLLSWASCPLLIAAPLLTDVGPVAIGPATVSSRGQAWLVCLAGVALLIAGAYLATALAAVHAAFARALLGPRGEELRRQVRDLTRSRLRLVDAFDVERRRIERDLHDGAQQHLVALAMTLDLARIELDGTPHAEASRLLDTAHAQATATLRELRELISGISPPVLAELGLPGAVRELADRCPLPVATAVDLPGRLPRAVETTAYFLLAEALTNAAKHSHATSVTVNVQLRARTVHLQVADDGQGGADPERGSGLTGLGDRVAAVAGRLTLTSPPGGPTSLRAEIPLGAGEHHDHEPAAGG